ncbi:YdgH/BhsA/McbA-like domain containing protein, partial [Salmonella enterica subsp. enterica serovar Infantis]
FGNSGNWRVVADVYKADAPKADAPQNRVINGIVELPKDQAVHLEPYDTVTVQGFYRSQPEDNDAITKAAKQKGAYAFYIVRQIEANQGGNQRITAFI